MKHTVLHNLGSKLAHKCVNKAFESYKTKFASYSPMMDWQNDNRAKLSFSISGNTISGFIDVSPTTIKLDFEVPFIFLLFKNQAMGIIEKEIQFWINKAKAGKL